LEGEGLLLDRVVLVSGTSGVGLRELYRHVRGLHGFEGCVADFEEALLSTAALPRGYGIVYLVTLASISRPQVVQHFKKTARRLVEGLAGRGCARALVFAHLSYIVRGNIFPNPVVRELLGYARERALIYLMDDYYDAVARIVSKLGSPFHHPLVPYQGARVEHVDPLSYLEWRGYDLNQLGLLEAWDPGLEIHIVASKHPYPVVERLLHRLYEGAPLRTVYVSHPISYQRTLYSRLPYHAMKRASLGGMPLVMVIEAFKEALLGVEDLIPYSPTTIDEYLKTNARLYYEDTYRCDQALQDCAGPRDPGRLEEMSVPSIFWVRRRDRWPEPRDGMIRRLTGEEPGDVDLVEVLARTRLFLGKSPYDQAVTSAVFEVCQEWLSIFQATVEGDYHSTISRRILTLVKNQIEARDYQYVAQSDSTLAVTPVLVVSEEAARLLDGEGGGVRPGLYIVPSRGMDAEISRAKALGKPVQLALLPVCYEALHAWLEGLVGPGGAVEIGRGALREAVACGGSGDYPVCGSHLPVEELDAVRDRELLNDLYRCMAGLVEGRVFGTLRGGVAPCFARQVLVQSGDVFDGLVGAYRGSVSSCLA